MNLFKSLSRTIRNMLAVLDKTMSGIYNIVSIFEEATTDARTEALLESRNNQKEIAENFGVSEEELDALRKTLPADV